MRQSPLTSVARRSCALAVLIVGSGAAAAVAQSQIPMEQRQVIEKTVSVFATGVAMATPDMATINTGVQAEAETARDAMAANSTAMSRVIDGLKAAGVDPKDIRTTTVSINPRYAEPRPGKPPTVNGYFAQNQIRVTVRDLKKLGDLLDTTLTLGATQISGITFDISQAETLRDQARKAAMMNARRRAELYATAAGTTLGDVLVISEDSPAQQPRPMVGRAVQMSAAAVPVEAGEFELTATVHVTWAMKQP